MSTLFLGSKELWLTFYHESFDSRGRAKEFGKLLQEGYVLELDVEEDVDNHGDRSVTMKFRVVKKGEV